jgi:hypothetical protein
MKKTLSRKKPVSAERIARSASKGKDVSRFFTNSGKLAKPVQRANAPSATIDKLKFLELLLAEFPDLRDECEGYEGLVHLQMMEFALFTARECKLGNLETVAKCLRLAHRLLQFGDSEINNAVYVSYLEYLPRKGDGRDQIRMAMTSDLRQAWDDILDYLSKVSEK